jgi:hypothetical protein
MNPSNVQPLGLIIFFSCAIDICSFSSGLLPWFLTIYLLLPYSPSLSMDLCHLSVCLIFIRFGRSGATVLILSSAVVCIFKSYVLVFNGCRIQICPFIHRDLDCG